MSFIADVIGINKQAKAAQTASQTQSEAADRGIDEVRRQFDALQAAFAPYVQAGGQGLEGQQDLLGMNGAGPQSASIEALRASPQFTSLLDQGEDSILANASATGGLRGGNTQAALAQFSPQLLAQLIEQQYGRLGQMTTIGQNSVAGVGAAGQNSSSSIANLLQQQGAARAGGQIAAGNRFANIANAANKIGHMATGYF